MRAVSDLRSSYYYHRPQHAADQRNASLEKKSDQSRAGRIILSTNSGAGAYTMTSYGVKRMSDAEMKRRKRVAMYKAYAVEGRLKASLRSGVRWIKSKYSTIVHGF